MEALGPHQIELRVHGLTERDHGRVSGRVFANKLRQLVGALEESDNLQMVRASMTMFFRKCICRSRPPS